MESAEAPEPFRATTHALQTRDQLVDRFWATVPDRSGEDIETLPTSLAVASAAVLGVVAVGLSVADDRFRVPLGASDDEATAAERLQFTVGEGPCLFAMHTHTEIRVSGTDMNRRWPAFYEQLAGKTSYRSIASVPFTAAEGIDAAMDIYFRDNTGAFTADLDSATTIAELIGLTLQAAATPAVPAVLERDTMLPPWLYGPAARNRLRTWIAAGVVMAYFGANSANALDRLKAWAYGAGLTVEDATDLIINGDLRPQEMA
jgi:hypothetical protein